MDSEAQTPDNDPGWKDIGDQQVYTDEELQEFEKEYAKQQGWGERAYEATTMPVPHVDRNQQVQYEQERQAQVK
ncbi:hypothetical protein OESDEN_01542 [Oesophagostomum dentatum]|uniref:Uncharacterized protein n=1 Tax=Oesophagostomum dentatum TaxID=61180 RepID=A0A0B1TQS0_OESDE|nr:hypothetical protein OESDEN_01542 [Oesophagostomum dentatum]